MVKRRNWICLGAVVCMLFCLLPVNAETPRQAQSVRTVLNETMEQLANTVTAPAFGTNAGEWTVFSLARGGYFDKDSAYFAGYYDRIVETVNTTAAEVNLNGALHKTKSTDNSRLIMALTAIGKDATNVGNWDLVEAYSANGINWIRKQGMNGTIWALIALDCGGYETSDPTIRQQCVDDLLAKQHDDGGWSLITNKAYTSNVDITGMTLTALYPYRDQPEVKAACEQAIAWMSAVQLSTGGFPYGSSETSESCAWAVVCLTMWGINPDTDPRFIKDGRSAVDNLLSYYVAEDKMFAHQGTASNHMATDQCCYALVAYDRFLNGKPALYDYSDVVFEKEADGEMSASLGLPAGIQGGDSFNAILIIHNWDNQAGYKLIDLIVTVPAGVAVTEVTAGSSLSGGEVSWNLEQDTGKLRIVYFDPNENSTLTVSQLPAALFTVGFRAEYVSAGSKLNFAVSGMSVKLTSDSENTASMVVVNTEAARGTVDVTEGLSFSAKCLYTGDDVDLIPSTKKAVAVAVTGITGGTGLTYSDGTNTVLFRYTPEISAKTGVCTYVALVDANIAMENFVNGQYFTMQSGNAETLTFGDTNGDGVVNAQDALNVVDTWLRKGGEPTDAQILAMNVNGDSRVNTFDALGIVEAFVNKGEYSIIIKTATISPKGRDGTAQAVTERVN